VAAVLMRNTELEYDWHQIRITTSEMIHFIRQMQAYTQLEVIECSWKALMEFFARREGDLDAMIDAHQSYLDRMVKKVLLISPKVGREVSLTRKHFCRALIVMPGEPVDPSPGGVLDHPSVPRGNCKYFFISLIHVFLF
jgi:hypothetical protein